MTMVGAFDIHRRQLTYELVDVDSGEVQRGRVETPTRQSLRAWLADLPVLPKAMEIDGVLNVAHTSTLHIEARDFAEAYERWGQHIGAALPQLIEGEIIEDDTEPEEQPA